jgi:hypothetical protein
VVKPPRPRKIEARFREGRRKTTRIAIVWLNEQEKLVDMRRRVFLKDGREAVESALYPWRTLALAAAWFDEICDQHLEEGWRDISYGGCPSAVIAIRRTKRQERAAEKEFTAINAGLAEALETAEGDEAVERAAIDRALARYAKARDSIQMPRWSNALWFFGDHGTGLYQYNRPALQRATRDVQTFRRWERMLNEAIARAERRDRAKARARDRAKARARAKAREHRDRGEPTLRRGVSGGLPPRR